MEKPVSALSGGERAKLALAVFESEHGNFLVLDEPTNHLDLQARESLEEALKAFDGTVLFVSHDRYFIGAIADKVMEIEGGKFTEFKGSYNEYLALKKVQKAKDEAPMPAVTAKPNENFKSKQARADEAKKRQRVKEIERRIALLEEEESALSADLADPAVTSNYTLLKEKCTRLEEIKSQTDALYEEYENLI
jgi:ATP-binding cassette subfamily F protein 3